MMPWTALRIGEVSLLPDVSWWGGGRGGVGGQQGRGGGAGRVFNVQCMLAGLPHANCVHEQ